MSYLARNVIVLELLTKYLVYIFFNCNSWHDNLGKMFFVLSFLTLRVNQIATENTLLRVIKEMKAMIVLEQLTIFH